MKPVIAAVLLLFSIAAAQSLGVGPEGRVFGKLGAYPPKKGVAGGGGGIAGALLLEDGSSIFLLEDNASQFCLEGGC